jgi:hypothetical protein
LGIVVVEVVAAAAAAGLVGVAAAGWRLVAAVGLVGRGPAVGRPHVGGTVGDARVGGSLTHLWLARAAGPTLRCHGLRLPTA